MNKLSNSQALLHNIESCPVRVRSDSSARYPLRIRMFLTGFVACLLVLLPLNNLAWSKSGCFIGKTAKVRIAGQLFVIPLRYSGVLWRVGERQKSIHLRKHQGKMACPSGNADTIPEPVEARLLLIYRHDWDDALASGIPEFHGVQFRLYRTSGSIDDRILERFHNQVERHGTNLEAMPKIAGFYAIDRIAGAKLFRGPFMAAPGGMTTPNGKPVVVDCFGPGLSLRKFEDPLDKRPNCTVEYDLAPGIAFRYRFWAGSHAIDEWQQLDNAARRFVRRLMVESNR